MVETSLTALTPILRSLAVPLLPSHSCLWRTFSMKPAIGCNSAIPVILLAHASFGNCPGDHLVLCKTHLARGPRTTVEKGYPGQTVVMAVRLCDTANDRQHSPDETLAWPRSRGWGRCGKSSRGACRLNMGLRPPKNSLHR